MRLTTFGSVSEEARLQDANDALQDEIVDLRRDLKDAETKLAAANDTIEAMRANVENLLQDIRCLERDYKRNG